MGYWYWRNLKKDWVIDENTTNRFDLPEKGHVSALLVKLRTQNETYLGTYDDPHPVQRVTKLRILGNGNFEIDNVSGRQMHAMNFWDKGVMPKEGLCEIDTAEQEQYLYIMFGRYLGDPRFGMILEKFAAGVQFEETNNISTTYYVNNETKYTVYALMRKNPEPGLFNGGFLRKRNIITKDAASETQYGVKLPTLNKLRQIHIFSEPTYASGVLSTTIFTLVQYLWLSILSREEYIIDNIKTDAWARFIHDFLGRLAHTQKRIYTQTGGGYHDTMIYEKRNSQAQNLMTNFGNIVGDATTDLTRFQRIYSYDAAGAELISRLVLLDTFGICLHGDIPLLLVDPMSDEPEWLDAAANKDVYVEVTEGSSAGNWYIVLDELQKTYPD